MLKSYCIKLCPGLALPSSDHMWPELSIQGGHCVSPPLPVATKHNSSSKIMGLCPRLITSFKPCVWAAHFYATCCYNRHVKVCWGELTGHKSATTFKTGAPLPGWSVHKALPRPLYRRTHQQTCMLCIKPLMSSTAGELLQQEIITFPGQRSTSVWGAYK